MPKKIQEPAVSIMAVEESIPEEAVAQIPKKVKSLMELVKGVDAKGMHDPGSYLKHVSGTQKGFSLIESPSILANGLLTSQMEPLLFFAARNEGNQAPEIMVSVPEKYKASLKGMLMEFAGDNTSLSSKDIGHKGWNSHSLTLALLGAGGPFAQVW